MEVSPYDDVGLSQIYQLGQEHGPQESCDYSSGFLSGPIFRGGRINYRTVLHGLPAAGSGRNLFENQWHQLLIPHRRNKLITSNKVYLFQILESCYHVALMLKKTVMAGKLKIKVNHIITQITFDVRLLKQNYCILDVPRFSGM